MAETKEKRFNLDDLDQQLVEGEPKIDDFKEAYKELQDALIKLQGQVEYAKSVNRENESEFNNFHKRLAGDNESMLIDKLKNQGLYFKKNDANVKKAFADIGYRLMEKTRVGKRSEVYHTIMRVFVAQQTEIPKVLMEPFKPLYSDDMFKVFIFSFLGGILGQEKDETTPE